MGDRDGRSRRSDDGPARASTEAGRGARPVDPVLAGDEASGRRVARAVNVAEPSRSVRTPMAISTPAEGGAGDQGGSSPVQTPRVAMLMRFLTDDLGLSGDELRAMRSAIDERLRGDVRNDARGGRRTLYLPSDRLDEL